MTCLQIEHSQNTYVKTIVAKMNNYVIIFIQYKKKIQETQTLRLIIVKPIVGSNSDNAT